LAHTVAATPKMAARQGLAIVVLAAIQLMLVLDVTVVNVALPEIASGLDLSRATSTWVMTIYTTLFGGFVLAGGKTADLLGARRVLVLGLSLFLLASLVSAVAQHGATLLAGRGLQGIGAALSSPSALSVLLGSVSKNGRGRAIAVWGSLSAVGTALGVSLGGLVTSALGWEWIFAINLPIGLIVLAALPVVTRPVAGTPSRPDLLGAALVTAGTAAVVYGLVRAGSADRSSSGTLAAILGGLVLWLAFAAVERRVEQPMLRLSLLREPSVRAGAFLMIVATGLMVGNFFIGSFTLQRAYGDSALRVGLEFLPVAIGVGVGAQLAGQLLDRLPARLVAIAGLGLAAIGEGLAAGGDGRRTTLIVGLALAALGIGAVFVTAFRTALATAGPTDGGLRSALVATAHELGGAFGVAVLSTLAATALTTARPGPGDFSTAYTTAAITAAVAVLVAAALVPSAHSSPTGGHHH